MAIDGSSLRPSAWRPLLWTRETNQRLGRHQDALVHYRRAVDLLRQTDDRYHTALAYRHLGDAHAEAGTTRDARTAWRQALHLLRQIDHPEAIQVQQKLAGQRGSVDTLRQ